MAYAKRLPAKCIAGRWMSIAGTEDTLDRIGQKYLQPALTALLTKAVHEFPDQCSGESSAIVASSGEG
eukprot:13287940-Alexandrium_andersonii.AAC.1